MRRTRYLALVFGLSAVLVVGTGGSGSSSSDDDEEMRWDLVNINFSAPATVSAGGSASARASDGSKITMTGSGRFDAEADIGERASGGGTWTTYNAAGVATGSGDYKVTRFVSFVPAPGAPPVPRDTIASINLTRAGLLVVAVRYSSGETGVLTVSCHLVGTPDSVLEGITTTKGYVTYWNAEPPPPPPANGNRTLFHVLGDDGDEDEGEDHDD